MEAPRFPANIRLFGVMQKEKSKMFMTSVLWSDGSEIIVYRTFVEFKNIHRQIKKSFPPENPLNRSTRIIPRFQDSKIKMVVKTKGQSKSLLALSFLDKYCTELLNCDPRVSQSPDIIRFFQPKDQDLNPEFAKNSVVIMPSDDSIDVGQNKSIQAGNVTQPFVTETYRCVAPYETKDTKNHPFKVQVNEKVDVLIKDKAGWWLVENENKKLAWFPAPYLEKMDADSDEEDENTENVMYTAVRNYKATNGDEVSVEMGSVVEVLQKSHTGWWLVRYGKKAGYLPSMYLQPYFDPRPLAASIHQERRSSNISLGNLDVQSPKTLGGSSTGLSLSQGNLFLQSGLQHSSPTKPQPAKNLESNLLSLPSTAKPKAAMPPGSQRANHSSPTSPSSPFNRPPPIIRIEADADEASFLSGNRKGSLESQSSDYSSSDELNLSTVSFTPSLGPDDMDMPQRSSSTLPAPVTRDQSLDTGLVVNRMIHSTSDPNLSKSSSMPKVPPRPAAQEILSRCTTITRKNASKGQGGDIGR